MNRKGMELYGVMTPEIDVLPLYGREGKSLKKATICSSRYAILANIEIYERPPGLKKGKNPDRVRAPG